MLFEDYSNAFVILKKMTELKHFAEELIKLNYANGSVQTIKLTLNLDK